MKSLEIVTPNHPQFNAVCKFAQSIYNDTIRVNIHNLPEMFIALFDENYVVYGCIGLKTVVSSEFFLNDRRYLENIHLLPHQTKVGEQSVFAVRKCPIGVPMLISTVSAYANLIGIQKIAFAGIDISIKAVSQLGFDVDMIGKIDSSVFSKQGLSNYSHWLKNYHPFSCILDTAKAPLILETVAERFYNKVKINFDLRPCVAA